MNIGLCRVSSISQKDNTSLSNQKRMIKDYCKMYGIKLSNVISEYFSDTTSFYLFFISQKHHGIRLFLKFILRFSDSFSILIWIL